MRTSEVGQHLMLMLAAARRDPALIGRPNRPAVENQSELQRLCDRVGERAVARGLTEEIFAEIAAG
jgi:hypothetical protein